MRPRAISFFPSIAAGPAYQLPASSGSHAAAGRTKGCAAMQRARRRCIVISPKAGAPFHARSANRVGQETLRRRHNYRRESALHRSRCERSRRSGTLFLVPKNGKVNSQMTTIQISDLNAHTLYNCFMLGEPHQCVLSYHSPSATSVFRQGVKTGELPNDQGSTIHEELGKQVIRGIETVGTRDSVT